MNETTTSKVNVIIACVTSAILFGGLYYYFSPTQTCIRKHPIEEAVNCDIYPSGRSYVIYEGFDVNWKDGKGKVVAKDTTCGMVEDGTLLENTKNQIEQDICRLTHSW